MRLFHWHNKVWAQIQPISAPRENELIDDISSSYEYLGFIDLPNIKQKRCDDVFDWQVVHTINPYDIPCTLFIIVEYNQRRICYVNHNSGFMFDILLRWYWNGLDSFIHLYYFATPFHWLILYTTICINYKIHGKTEYIRYLKYQWMARTSRCKNL